MPILPILGNTWLRSAIRLVGILILVMMIGSVLDMVRKQDIVHEYQAAYDKAKQENDELKRKLAEAQTPEFVEREARNKLGLVRDGETIVLIDTPQPEDVGTRGSDVAGEQALADQNLPNWKKWWTLLF